LEFTPLATILDCLTAHDKKCTGGFGRGRHA
jgi:hypothetical protein